MTLLCLCMPLSGCTNAPSDESVPEPTQATEQKETVIRAPADKNYIFTSNAPVFSLDHSFYNDDIEVELKTAEPAEIHYTLDGTMPDRTSEKYSEPLYFDAEITDFPKAHTIMAKAFYSDGTESDISVQTYFVAKGASERFSEYVFSVSGDPSVLTEKPDGIFYGENYKLRGRESEREVYVSAWNPKGEQLLGQFCGVRIYGGASRESTIKSMKLFARKSYSSGVGAFHTDLFRTPLADGSGNVIDEYDKLVLRNSGNDFQFAFIRDELCQTLAVQAGFADYEAVVPAVCYLNGQYYGLFWLHETYCDDYFKDKYPNAAAMGKFIICEGTDTEKTVDEEDAESIHAVEFNDMYNEFSSADLTDDATYARLCALMDVENYLDYFAFNIYINNRDWPQNNMRCYRYALPEGEAAGEGVYDGKWRFLLHDMDYSMGMYEQPELQPYYNNLSHILTEGDERHSPLFASLMERADCRSYFNDSIRRLADGVLSAENISDACSKLSASRYSEQQMYYKHLEHLRNSGDKTIWTYAGHLNGQLDIIRSFAQKRGKFMINFVDEWLASYEE